MRSIASGEREERRARTDERGRYEMPGCRAAATRSSTDVGLVGITQPPLRVLDQGYQGRPCWTLECAHGAGTAVSVSAGQATRRHRLLARRRRRHLGRRDRRCDREARRLGAESRSTRPTGRTASSTVHAGRATADTRRAGCRPARTSPSVSRVWTAPRGVARQLYKGRALRGRGVIGRRATRRAARRSSSRLRTTTYGIDFALTAGSDHLRRRPPLRRPGHRCGRSSRRPHRAIGDRVGPRTPRTDADGRYLVPGLADGEVPTFKPSRRDEGRLRPGAPQVPRVARPGVSRRRLLYGTGADEALLKGTPVAVGAGAPATGVDFRAPRGRDRIRTSHRRVVGRARAQCPRVLPLSLRSRRPHGDDRLPRATTRLRPCRLVPTT